MVDEDFNERYQIDLQPKNINFRAKNVVKGMPMKVHQNYGMVNNIEHAITAKGNKSKAGGN